MEISAWGKEYDHDQGNACTMVLRQDPGLLTSQSSLIKVPKKGKKLIAKVISGQIIKDEYPANKLGFILLQESQYANLIC